MKDVSSNSLPTISFVFPTFNEEQRIVPCLKAIRNQSYPKDKIEIIVADGGSTDTTVEIARSLGAQVITNDKRLPSFGLATGFRKATGNYIVCMAADNVIFDPDWTNKIIKPFLDDPKNTYLSFCKVVNDPRDNVWSKYLNEDTDPFNAFVYGNASHPDKFAKAYPIYKTGDNYVIYSYPIIDHPLIALAQCAVVKKDEKIRQAILKDDIYPVIQIIKMAKYIAYVQKTGIYHYSLSGSYDFAQKFNNRIYNSITSGSYAAKDSYASTGRKLRRYIFFLLGITLVVPTIQAIIWSIRKQHRYLLLHPLASFIICYYIAYNLIKVRIFKK